MTEQDIKNFEIIKRLVKERFCLDQRSFAIFEKELFAKEVAEEYAFVEPDLRLRIKLDDSINEAFDKGWELFKKYFAKFLAEVPVKYTDYRENKIEINGQKIKLRKVIFNWMFERPTIALFLSQGSLKNTRTFLKKEELDSIATFLFEKEENIEAFSKSVNGFFVKSSEKGTRVGTKVSKEGKNITLYVSTEKFSKNPCFDKILNNALDKITESIGKEALPKTQGLELVVSLNFADWFLCSTAEKWSSCLSLSASYSDCYWSGLPALINDKNRCMIYLTDGKKKNYKGIEVDKVIARTWGILNTNGKIRFIREYPGNFSLSDIIERTFTFLNLPLGDKTEHHFYGKYQKEAMFFIKHRDSNKQEFVDIFNDGGTWEIIDKKSFLVRYRQGDDGGRSRISLNSSGDIVKRREYEIMNYSGGLTRLIENDQTLMKAFDNTLNGGDDDYYEDEDEDDYYEDDEEDEED